MALFNRQRTGLVIVQDVCAQLGLPVPVLAAGNISDATTRQLWALLTYCGRRLLKPTGGHRWQALQKTWALITDPVETLYDLPLDWDSFIDATAWNTVTRLPLYGAPTPQQWARLQGSALGATYSLIYRVRGNQFELFTPPGVAQTIHIDYSSRGWVQHTDPTVGVVFQDAMTNDADECLLDSDLLTCYLKLRFLIEKGFDTTVALADFNGALESAINADKTAMPLRTDGEISDGLMSGHATYDAGGFSSTTPLTLGGTWMLNGAENLDGYVGL